MSSSMLASASSSKALLVLLHPALTTIRETSNPPTGSSQATLSKKLEPKIAVKATTLVNESTRWCTALDAKMDDFLSSAIRMAVGQLHFHT